MFCPKCNMIYEITNNVKNVLHGGKDDEESDSENEEEDIKISKKKIKKGNIINKILKSTKPSEEKKEDEKNISVLTKEDMADYIDETDIINSKNFKELSPDNRTII